MLLAFLCVGSWCVGQNKGSLFIIGGGDRSADLMEDLVQTADLRPSDYIVILPMATSIPEESVAYISGQLLEHCKNPIRSFNFNKAQADNNQDWIDSVKNARLIYITGGDQNKFMEVVRGTKLYAAMHEAYHHGATVSGTSAGAAVMSQIMITGAQKGKKETDTFKQIEVNSVVTSEGMGFLTEAIVDQHFIKRSRYNRLLSAKADHPDKMVIGIDEGTAIVVKGKEVRVSGVSEVVVVSGPKHIAVSDNNKVSFKQASLSLYTDGQRFKLK